MGITSRLTQGLLIVLAVTVPACSMPMKGSGDYDVGYKERGYASWYGEEFHGRPTASGEIYDQGKLTAAHRRLPLGSLVRVTNVRNGRQIEVRINDRGPFVDGRIIDLSYAAAERLGIIHSGITPVLLEVIRMGVGGRPAGALDRATKPKALTMERRSRHGDTWIVQAGTSGGWVGRRPIGALLDERRSRRPAEQMPGDAGAMNEGEDEHEHE